MSKVSERSITHGKRTKERKWFLQIKKVFAEVKDVGSQQEVVQGDDGGGSQDAWLQLQILLSQVTPDMLKNLFLYLLLHRRITHSFKEGEEFRKDEDIHKWGANWRSIGDIFNLRSLASAQISLDMLRRQASIGELYNPRSHSWADFSPFIELPFQQLGLQGHPVSWEGEAFNLRKKRRGVAGQRY